jgi:hypothetical protein
MANRQGSGFIGSNALKTSTVNLEIIPTPPSDYYKKKYGCYRFSFLNTEDCTVIVNGTEIFLRAGQGFETNEVDAEIYSFIIKESGIHYNFVGGV